ncbi:MAG: protein SCO1/2 [Salibacteraceae bacterium]|jgi:protein SCO1/2|tara:strand:+ start:2973 stop:3599 length:627 start_codon:yes stop_codon:yes gene_type:complete
MRTIFSISLIIILTSCDSEKSVLPILGQHDYETRTEAGKTISDTIHYTVPDFSFLGHRSVEINNNTIAGKVTIADFFFTTCPTICPVMSRNMKKISQEFLGKKNLTMLSFSIDAIHDSIPVLNKYASKLNVENENWHFMVCEKKKTFELAKGFMISAAEDKNAPGGLIHSGAFILLDGQQRIRAYYDGTKEEDVDKAIADIKTLLDEI